MAELLARARQSLSYNQLDDAIQQLLQASTQQPLNPDVWFTLATALARKGGQPTMCCIAYLRTLQLLRADAADDSTQQSPASTAMMSVSADNCWLLAGKLLPTGWPAALQDSSLNTRMCRGLLQHLSTVLQPQQHLTAAAADGSSSGEESCSHVQLLCVGGMGVQAMQLAAVASEAQSRAVHAAEAAAAATSPGSSSSEGSPCWVPSMGVAYIPGSQLTAHVASQLLLDNDLDDIVDVCSWPEFMQQQREQEPPTAVLALLAAAVQPNWGAAVTACMQACHRVAALTSTSYSRSSRSMLSLLCPGRIRVWTVPVSCKELLDLNQVDLQGIAEHTAGRYNYAAANARLRRSSRAAQVSRHNPVLLSAPAVVLELSLQQLLAELQQRYQSPQQRQQQGAAQTVAAAACDGTEVQPCPVAAALAGSHPVEASTVLTVQQAGQVDCLVWWLDFEWAPGYHTAFAPSAAAAASVAADAAALGPQAADVLQPHAWQHVQYLPLPGDSTHQQGLLLQGQQVDVGQQLMISVSASAADLQLTASAAASSSSAAAAAAASPDMGVCTTAQQQQLQRQASDPSQEILPYHLSMLNDHARTVAFEKGIAGAVRALLQGSQQQESTAVQDGMQQLSLQGGGGAAAAASSAVPVVLDVGCGTGLLSMMAATAAAAVGGSVSITGCDREPALAQTAVQLVADNSLQQHIRVANKLSSQLSLAGATAAAGRKASGAAAKAKANGKQQQQEADLPGKASLVVHEVFGTDPLSEHVLPALLQVQQQLAASGAVFMPGRVRVVAAIAACPRLLQSIRIADILASLGIINTSSSAAGPASASTATANAAAGSDGAVCQMPAWDVSCLLALQPRKVELQLDELRRELLLLTVPQPVLTLDFQQPIKLSGKQVVQLPALESALLLQDWMAQQQQQQQDRQPPPGQYAGSNSSSSTEPAPNAAGAGSAADQGFGAPQKADDLLVVSWFEADCAEGGWLSTEPGNTRLGHWQQSVEFVRCAGPAATADGSFALQVSWNNDRVAFALGA